MEEIINEIDLNGNVISSHPKSFLQERMFLHKVAVIIPITKDGKIILAKVSSDKTFFPDAWACCVGGKVLSNESEEEAAKRESEEEIGFSFPIRKVGSVLHNNDYYKGLFIIFTNLQPISITDIKINNKEISELREFSIEEIKLLIENNPKQFASTFRAVIKEFIKKTLESLKLT